MNRFRDKVAVVTGGASGIGAATSKEFLREGARVVVVDLKPVDPGEFVADLDVSTEGLLPMTGDVGEIDDCRRVVAATVEAFGGIDCLVNNAASFVAEGLNATKDDWGKSWSTNVMGAMNMTNAAHDALKAVGNGAVVNVASITAIMAKPEAWTYHGTKGALLSTTKCMALDLGGDGIRVNTVSPGWTWTDATANVVDRKVFEDYIVPKAMIPRVCETVDVARAILFMCSDDAAYITGTDLKVDGGFSAMGPEGKANIV